MRDRERRERERKEREREKGERERERERERENVSKYFRLLIAGKRLSRQEANFCFTPIRFYSFFPSNFLWKFLCRRGRLFC